MSLKDQVNSILHAKIKRIAEECFRKANPNPKPMQTSFKPYSLPQEVDEMVAMLGRIESATDAELEAFAHYATTGSVRELTT